MSPVSAPAVRTVAIETAASIGQKRRAAPSGSGPEVSCQMFVTNEGASIRVAASCGGMTVASSPMATVGSPMPVTPFTMPAITKARNMKTRMVGVSSVMTKA